VDSSKSQDSTITNGAKRCTTCPACGARRLHGPAEIIFLDEHGEESVFPYYDCACCHYLFRFIDHPPGFIGA